MYLLFSNTTLDASGGSGAVLNRQAVGGSSTLGRRSREQAGLVDPTEEDSRDEAPSEVKVAKVTSFTPLHVTACWKEPGTTTDIYTVVLLLPSGVSAKTFLFKVLEEGRILELTVDWPRPLSDVEMMHTEWLTPGATNGFTEYHPRVVAVDNALKELRKHSHQKIKAVARFDIPFAVRKDFYNQENFEFEGSCKMIYIELKAITADYAEVHDVKDFKRV